MATRVTEDIAEIWKSYKQDQSNQELRNILIERYLPLVRYNAERVWAKLPEGVDLNDLISAGVFGLMDAIDAFDLGRGVKFETLLRPANPRRNARRTADDGLGAAAGPQQGQQARIGPQRGRSRVRPPPFRHRNGLAAAASRSPNTKSSSAKRAPSISSASTRSGTRPTATRTSAKSTSSKTARARTRPAASKSGT